MMWDGIALFSGAPVRRSADGVLGAAGVPDAKSKPPERKPPEHTPPRRAKVGLALGGGAARGWSHIGAIEVLREAGITIDVVAGCSIGAAVPARVAGRCAILPSHARAASLEGSARGQPAPRPLCRKLRRADRNARLECSAGDRRADRDSAAADASDGECSSRVERRTVAPDVGGSNPLTHPTKQKTENRRQKVGDRR